MATYSTVTVENDSVPVGYEVRVSGPDFYVRKWETPDFQEYPGEPTIPFDCAEEAMNFFKEITA